MTAAPRGDGPAAEHPDRATWIGAAVTLLALAGICALLGEHLLLGALRLAAGLLAGAGAGAALLAVRPARSPRLLRRTAAGLLALTLALALTVPAVLSTRLADPADGAAAVLEPLGEEAVVHSLPGTDAPALVRTADGGALLVDERGALPVAAAAGDVLALSADGTRLLRATGTTTDVLEVASIAPGADGSEPARTLEGSPRALAGDLLVMRSCVEGLCRLSGVDLAGGQEPLWVVSAAAETRGADPAGRAVPAVREGTPGLLEAARSTGVLPTVPLRFDPGAGWVQLEAETGFPVGDLLAPADQECRIAATGPDPAAQQLQQEGPVVLTACSADDGALTASAHRDGQRLWTSEASPAGTWSVRLEHGRVLAAGTETGTGTTGEIVASSRQADWTAPGGQGIADAAAFTARIGIDGTRMIVTNDTGQAVAYDTADGTHLWTLPLSAPEAPVRGELAEGTAVLVDPVPRESPLDPRGAQRLRVVDAATGEVTASLTTAREIGALRPVGGGRALVDVDGETLLLGP